jgi:hypothetical protein
LRRGVGQGFKELLVWQKGRDLAVEIYKISHQGRFKTDFGQRMLEGSKARRKDKDA